MAGGWKGFIAQVAPTLAKALGGPLYGGALGKLAQALLGKDSASEDEVAEAVLKADPATLVKLKELDLEYEKMVTDYSLNLEKMATEDRASARAREVTTKDNWTPRVLAGVVVFAFLFVVWKVLSGTVEGMKDPNTTVLIGTLIGYVSAKADQVVGYYFGSSASSERKTELMGKK